MIDHFKKSQLDRENGADLNSPMRKAVRASASLQAKTPDSLYLDTLNRRVVFAIVMPLLPAGVAIKRNRIDTRPDDIQ